MMGIDAALKVTLPSALVDDTAHLDRQPEADNTEFTMPIQARVAGEFEIQPQPVSLTSGHGLFVETMRVGNSCTLTVEPRLSKETQLGSDDAQIGVIHGEHDALVGASRDEHGTVRAYTPSDPMNGIDWSVTARLGEPHVRDRDPQTVRRTRVYIDRRRPMHEGAREKRSSITPEKLASYSRRRRPTTTIHSVSRWSTTVEIARVSTDA